MRSVAASPKADPDAVLERFGAARAPELIAAVRALLESALVTRIEWNDRTLGEGGDELRRGIAKRHPELTVDTLDAIRWKWTFDWR